MDDSNIEIAIFNTAKGQLYSESGGYYKDLELKIETKLENFGLRSGFIPIFGKMLEFWAAKKNSGFQKIFLDFFESEPEDQHT